MESKEDETVSFVTLYARIVHELAKNPQMAQETLARQLNVTMRTVQRHLTYLERENYIHVDRERKPFTYQIHWNRKLPHFDQLRVGTFRPDILDRITRLEHDR